VSSLFPFARWFGTLKSMKINVDTAKEIIEHHFGKAPKEIIALEGGFANFVFHAKIDNKKYIIRISDQPTSLQAFMKEQWAVKKVSEYKVPVPEILEVANEASKFPYMIQEFIEAKPALTFPSKDRLALIKQMGKYTAIINGIQTSGYGHFFDWSSNQLSHNDSWTDYLDKELEVDERIAFFQKNKILDRQEILKFKKCF
jgi:aminoglycoside phosphotransferase (APT) family kinase protein